MSVKHERFKLRTDEYKVVGRCRANRAESVQRCAGRSRELATIKLPISAHNAHVKWTGDAVPKEWFMHLPSSNQQREKPVTMKVIGKRL